MSATEPWPGYPEQQAVADGLHGRWYAANAAAGRLTAQRCGCGRWRMPARHRCAACHSDRWQFEPVGDTASVVSWTISHRPFHFGFAEVTPLVIVIAEVVEGVRLFVHARPGGEALDGLDGASLIGSTVSVRVDGAGIPYAVLPDA